MCSFVKVQHTKFHNRSEFLRFDRQGAHVHGSLPYCGGIVLAVSQEPHDHSLGTDFFMERVHCIEKAQCRELEGAHLHSARRVDDQQRLRPGAVGWQHSEGGAADQTACLHGSLPRDLALRLVSRHSCQPVLVFSTCSEGPISLPNQE